MVQTLEDRIKEILLNEIYLKDKDYNIVGGHEEALKEIMKAIHASTSEAGEGNNEEV